MNKKQFQKVDCHVGYRVRGRRMALGISQTKLADALGVSFQQVQKYEKGSNRISASKLLAISHLLERSVSYFFDGADEVGGKITALVPDPGFVDADSREAFQMLRNYCCIENKDTRDGLRKLLASLAEKPVATKRLKKAA